MQLLSISNIFRNRVPAGSGEGLLPVRGMHWCMNDTIRLCGNIKH